MGSGEGNEVIGIDYDTKHILLFPGKGHSSPGVVSTFLLPQPFLESFKALKIINGLGGFFFPGVFFPGYSTIPINRGQMRFLAVAINQDKELKSRNRERLGANSHKVPRDLIPDPTSGPPTRVLTRNRFFHRLNREAPKGGVYEIRTV